MLSLLIALPHLSPMSSVIRIACHTCGHPDDALLRVICTSTQCWFRCRGRDGLTFSSWLDHYLLAGIESDIPGTTEHRVKDDQKDVNQDERNLGNEEAKNNMSEGQKMKSDIPFTSEHKEDHQ